MPVELIIILCSIIVLYIILIIIIGLVINSLTKTINEKRKAINVLMAQKYDLVIELGNLLMEKEIPLPKSIKDSINIKNHEGLKKYNTQERLSIKTLLTKTNNAMFVIAEELGLDYDVQYQLLKKSIEDIDINYRKVVASFNSQVTAYNYWIRMWLFRPYSVILKLKEKEIMY